MSIIHEALKKTNQSVITDKSAVKPQLEKHSRGASGAWGPLFIGVLCLLVAGPFVAPLFLNPSTSGNSSVSGQFAIEEAPLPANPAGTRPLWGTFKQGKFVLSGIVYAGDSSFCLINGMVLRQGERVGNATVEAISSSSVVLDVQCEKITLLAAE